LKQSSREDTRSPRLEEIIRQIREAKTRKNLYSSKTPTNSHFPVDNEDEPSIQLNSDQDHKKEGESAPKKVINRKKIIASKQKDQSASGDGQKNKTSKSKKKRISNTEEVKPV
jgi:hypothetical protein